MSWSAFVWMIVLVPMTSVAQQNSNHCNLSLREGDTRSVCNGRTLPRSKTRGITNRRLVCTSNADTYIRTPQQIPDFEAWAAAIKVEGSRSQSAFAMRNLQPEIKWAGRVPYSTVERWEWEACVFGQAAHPCGTRQECRTVSVPYSECDSQNKCTTRYRQERQCDTIVNSCWYDQTVSEALHCSNESLTFDAKFERDANWNPSNPDYYEFIPNKYDLLPGEVESVQVFNSSSVATRLSPKVEIGDAWNKYRPKLSGSAIGAQCRQNANEQLSVSIVTERRLKKNSPNAFRLPVRFDGQSVPPLLWSRATDRAGNDVKSSPRELRLSDASSAMVALMARQSRENAERERAKAEQGLGITPDPQAPTQANRVTGFFKDTSVRLRLVEDKWWGKSIFSAPTEMRDAEAVSTANYSFSRDQNIRTSDFWTIPLNDAASGVDLYRRSNWFDALLFGRQRALRPNQRYLIQVSMFQKGVPFYYQGCKDDPERSRFKCFFGFGDHYSRPLEIPFWTEANLDERSIIVRLLEFHPIAGPIDWAHRRWRSRDANEDNAVPERGR